MARFLLIRHGQTELTGQVLSGRRPGVHLSAAGREQARALVPLLRDYDIRQIVSSPLERAWETAQPLADALGLAAHSEPAITEVNFGVWEGRSLAELREDECWQRFNTFRSGTPIPKGEAMQQVQTRMISALLKLHEANPSETIAVFSHGDPLKTVVCYFCCIPLDCMLRFDIDTGSLSVLDVSNGGSVLRCINCIAPSCVSNAPAPNR